MIVDDEIQALLKGDFSIDEFDFIITPIVDGSGPIISGPGTIYQDTNHGLRVKVFCKSVKYTQAMIGFGPINHRPGQLIEDKSYYNLCVRIRGEEWVSPKVMYDGNFNMTSGNAVILGQLHSLKRIATRDPSDSSSFKAIIPTAVAIPANTYVKDRSGSELKELKISSGSFEISIIKERDHLLVRATSEHLIFDEDSALKMIRGISLATGKNLRPCHIVIGCGTSIIEKLISYDKSTSNKTLPSPIPNSGPHEASDFGQFIEQYFLLEKTTEELIYGYWYKNNKAWQSGMENSALAISVGIEGILKIFNRDYDAGADFIAKINAAKKAIKKLKFTDSVAPSESEISLATRINNVIQSALSNSIKPKPNRILESISSTAGITPQEISDWKALRNTSAHAEIIDNNAAALQKQLFQIHSALGLFYKLCFKTMSYSGKINPYHQEQEQ